MPGMSDIELCACDLPPKNGASSCVRLAIKEKGAINGQEGVQTRADHLKYLIVLCPLCATFHDYAVTSFGALYF